METRRGVRRRSVVAAGTAAAAGLLPGCSDGPADAPDAAPPAPAHQPGVVTRPPDRALLVALEVTAAAPGATLRSLADRLGRANAAGAAEVTLAVGASLFDGRFGLAGQRPPLLTAMPAFPNDVPDPAWSHGDLLLQICAPTDDRAAAVAEDLLNAAGKGSRVRWRLAGFRPENGTTAAGLPATRNLFGFREGAGNPDPGDAALMDRLVWTSGEPAWAAGGTYQVVRLIRFATELWNRDPVSRQEAMLGRHREDGSPLAGGAEDAAFDYAGDPEGLVTPVDAHIRRANPRTPEVAAHRILRRGYSYRKDGSEGLIFVCFQRDPEQGFAAAQRRLAGEALDRYVLPFGGGYYFVPPSAGALSGLLPG
ncbi:peroxidase [Actinoplanes sp. NBRC 14428]|nr:peroxidase [Actinoplanes sp. NBRC 14428]